MLTRVGLPVVLDGRVVASRDVQTTFLPKDGIRSVVKHIMVIALTQGVHWKIEGTSSCLYRLLHLVIVGPLLKSFTYFTVRIGCFHRLRVTA